MFLALKILFPCLVLISLPTSNSLNNRVHLLFIIFLLSRSFQLHLFNSSLLSTCTDHAHVTKLHRTLWMWFSFKQCQLQKWRRLIHWTFSRCCILFSSYCIILHGIWFDVDKFSFFVFLFKLRGKLTYKVLICTFKESCMLYIVSEAVSLLKFFKLLEYFEVCLFIILSNLHHICS